MKNTALLVSVLLVPSLLPPHPAAPAEQQDAFRAGAAAVDITPKKLPVVVNGGMRERTADTIVDRLHARCLVLSDGSETIAVAVVDNCGVPRDLLDRAKEIAHTKTGIRTDHMLISATHTHSAPSVWGALGTGVQEDYAAALPALIAAGIERAQKNLVPAAAGWGVAQEPKNAFCRRWLMKPGTAPTNPFSGKKNDRARMNPGYRNPDAVERTGPRDTAVSVLSIRTPAGRPLALLANYSTHYAGAPALSADYFGVFAGRIAELLGAGDGSPPFVGILSNGTSGDANCCDFAHPRRRFDRFSVAADVARAAFKAYKGIEHRRDVSLAMTERTLAIPVRMPSKKEVREAQAFLEKMDHPKPRTIPEVYARETVLLAGMPPTRELKLQAIRIGDLGIAAIPNEVFAATGLAIKKRSPLQPTFTISLANGCAGYIPPPDQHALGGYTTWRARSSCLAVDAEPRIRATVLALLAAVAGEQPADGAVTAWTVTETRRVLRSERPGPSRTATLSAAGGEWESFQVLVRATIPVAGLTVVPGDLAGPRGATLSADDARLFRQHQMHITKGSHRHEDFRPGWYPAPLIPFRHPVTRASLSGARFDAVPFRLPAGQTHGFLVDIHVPPGTPPGAYTGTYLVKYAGGKDIAIPVALRVRGFDLPRVSTMVAQLGWPPNRMRGYYRSRSKAGTEKEPDWEAVERQCAAMLTRHRVNCWPPPGARPKPRRRNGAWEIPAEQIRALREYAARYHLNAFRVPRPPFKDPEKQREELAAWLKAWDAAAAALEDILFYIYLRDEPNDQAAYASVRTWGTTIRSCNTRVRVMVTEQTSPQKAAWGDLYGAIDIWCPLYPLFDPASAARRRQQGETIWTYTALCQGGRPSPWWEVDFPLLHYRVPAWICRRYRITGQLYWGGMSFWRAVDDPWTEPDTCKEDLVFNGEGVLVYPGRDAGYEGIAPSLRLKAFRDGIEDYEYMALLEQIAGRETVEKIIQPVAGSWFDWDRDPRAYEAARCHLAAMIEKTRR